MTLSDHVTQFGIPLGIAGQQNESSAPVTAGTIGAWGEFGRIDGGGGMSPTVMAGAHTVAAIACFSGQDLAQPRLGQFDTENGANAGGMASLVVQNKPRHTIGVGKSHGRHPQVPRSPHDVMDTGDAGVKRKRRMSM